MSAATPRQTRSTRSTTKRARAIRRFFHSDPAEIDRRISQLENEWDIERVLELNAATIALAGTVAARRDRRAVALPTVVLAFLLQHAIQGWCPPMALFRRLRIRTRREIDTEKNALRVQRGDYERLEGAVTPRAEAVIAALEEAAAREAAAEAASDDAVHCRC